MKEIILPAHFLAETSLNTLYTDTINGFDTPRGQNAGRVQVVNKIYVAAPRNNAVGVRATTRSSAEQYDTRMWFEGVEYIQEDEDVGANTFAFEASDGQEYVIAPIGYNNNDVKVSCSCLDFYYRFAVWNHSDGSLFGKPPPPYTNKTDNREPVNPNRIPGLCKHLIKLADDLRRERFLR